MNADHLAAEQVDVVVVGGGPAGLSVATELRRRGAATVVVIEREATAGGVPRHTDHVGFGMRDLRRVMSGPRYAAALVKRAERAGVEIRSATTVTDWIGDRTLALASSDGTSAIAARAVVLATGVRERPRSARLVPGDRPAGVYTTAAIQQLAQRGIAPGTRAVIVGAEHVSFSAVLTLRHAGCSVAAMVTPLAHHQTYWPLRIATATRHRVKVFTGVDIASIHGRPRVERVELTNGRAIQCDTVVFTGDWIPEHELARRAGVTIDASHRGPLVDGAARTDRTGVFAIGNLVHPAETADVCALHGRHAASAVMEWLAVDEWPSRRLRVLTTTPIEWVSPAWIDPLTATPRDRFVLRVDQFVESRTIRVHQGERELWHGTVLGGSLVPNRSISIASHWTADIDPDGGDVVLSAEP